ncbi:porin family protein [Mucilaginibacter sp. PAMB04274]|uniref:porin family protein n=1 Tax=Mucilaginibacter sp. PAMB04274 TaxID=3138568 RepID=UPI0031F71A83
MKKYFYLLAITLCTGFSASAQFLPSFNFGLKAGANLSSFSTENTLSSSHRAGYLVGAWARVGAVGWHFQPELYYTSKNVKLKDATAGAENTAEFQSIDLPLLVGRKFGMFGVAARVNTGPLISFAINHDQSVGDAFNNAARLRVHDQNYAWQFGAGLDFQRMSLDLRYELGLNKLRNGRGDSEIRANLFNLTLGYRLFSL